MIAKKGGAHPHAPPPESASVINKNEHSTFRIGKPGNFNSLREVISIILWPSVILKLNVGESQCQKSVVVINILQMIRKLLDHSRRHCCRSSSEELQQCFIIIGTRSYLLKEQLQIQYTEKSFVYVYEVIIQCYPNFVTSLYFRFAFIR